MVTEPAMKLIDKGPAGNTATEVVQTTVSAPLMPRTGTPATPTVSEHLAVVDTVDPAEVQVIVLVASTALKYLGGRAMVILPPIGMAVAVTKPRVIAPVLTAPGTLSLGVANTMGAPLAS